MTVHSGSRKGAPGARRPGQRGWPPRPARDPRAPPRSAARSAPPGEQSPRGDGHWGAFRCLGGGLVETRISPPGSSLSWLVSLQGWEAMLPNVPPPWLPPPTWGAAAVWGSWVRRGGGAGRHPDHAIVHANCTPPSRSAVSITTITISTTQLDPNHQRTNSTTGLVAWRWEFVLGLDGENFVVRGV